MSLSVADLLVREQQKISLLQEAASPVRRGL